jgi:hypothetical protein
MIMIMVFFCWRARRGIPLNMAYQPTEMMKIDIGEPVPPSEAHEADYMVYQVCTCTYRTDNETVA